MLCGLGQFGLLGDINAGSSTAKAGAAAQAHFDKYKRRSILHDQVDFTKPTAKIALEQF